MDAVVLNNVTKILKKRRVLDDVSLCVPDWSLMIIGLFENTHWA